MLNIGRMGPGSQRYYLDHVAHRVEDYYLGRGEAAGVWLGHGLERLGLHGQVDAEHLSRVLAGQHPTTGQQLATHPSRQVPGFDLAFRAPKSVSLLWALADEPTSQVVEAAHDHAVVSALAYLEAEVVHTRRGTGGVDTAPVDGLVAAGFRHRTSRAGDPLLHTHVLAANLVHTRDDGVWRTLDSRALFAHAKTAGTVYQAALRHQLTRTLGVEWGPVINGCADLAGVDRDWIDAFSKRRTAIVAELVARGETSAKAAQVATLATRQPKPMQDDQPTLRARWRDEARRLGMPEGWWRPLMDRHEPGRREHRRLVRQLVDQEQLTGGSSTFGRRDVIQAVAAALPDGAPVHELLFATDRLLRDGIDDGQLVPLGARRGELVALDPRPGADGSLRFTTRGLLLLEQQTASAAANRTHANAGVASARATAQAIGRRPSLSGEQAAMVGRLCRSGTGVQVVVGKAGTGKTFALDAARDAWTASGIRVTGVALAARAALELQDSAGIPSTTLARLLHRFDDPAAHGSPLAPGQVLVVDEAGMIGTRPLARLLAHAEERQVKVVLVGDHRQLPEIDAGGLFVALTKRLDTIELSGNRRQTHRWEQAALDQLRAGDIHQAVDAYQSAGRLITAETTDAIREQLVADWWHTHQQHPDGRSVMVALRRADVDDLNHRARLRLQAAGMLTGPTLDLDGATFQAGDRIVCLRNHRQLGVVNGTRATITHIRPDGAIDAADDHGHTIALPADYLEAGHVTHGYAITGHKAQGLTVDHTYVLGSDALYREWGYVAMSRGRETNRLYVHSVDDPIDGGPHTRQPHRDPVATTVRRLSTSRAEPPLTQQTVRLAARWRDTGEFLTSPEVAGLPNVEAGLRQRRTEHATVSERLDELAREQAGWVGPALRRSTRNHRDRIVAEIERQTRRIERLEREIAELTTRVQQLPPGDLVDQVQAEHEQLEAQLHKAVTGRVADLESGPIPHYLDSLLGPPPSDPQARDRWRRAVTTVENYRLRWNVTDPQRALGNPPRVAEQIQWRDRTAARQALDALTRPRERARYRGYGRGIAR